MSDEIKKVESETTEQTDTVETKEEVVETDFAKELDEDIKKFEKAEENRRGYELRKAKERTESLEGDEDRLAQVVRDELAKVMPVINASTQEMSLEALISQKTQDPALKELIKHHFHNSVNPNAGSVQDRLDMALAFATRKSIIKKAEELKIAAQNRSQIANNSQGSHQEGMSVTNDHVLSSAQLNDLKKRGWDDKKIERFKLNLKKNTGR